MQVFMVYPQDLRSLPVADEQNDGWKVAKIAVAVRCSPHEFRCDSDLLFDPSMEPWMLVHLHRVKASVAIRKSLKSVKVNGHEPDEKLITNGTEYYLVRMPNGGTFRDIHRFRWTPANDAMIRKAIAKQFLGDSSD